LKAPTAEAHGGRTHSSRSVDEMHALYRSGALLEEVGRRFSLSVVTVRRRFVEAGLHIRTAGESNALRVALKGLPDVERCMSCIAPGRRWARWGSGTASLRTV
jgi:hypothetical protein